MNECSGWAKDATGIDPFAVAQTPAQPAPTATNGAPVAGGAVKGAAGGALIGAVAGDAGKGAAVGATTGAVVSGVRGRRQQQQHAAEAQDTEAKKQAALATYQKAYSACIEGRGYTVK
jgi:hypothetical protein